MRGSDFFAIAFVASLVFAATMLALRARNVEPLAQAPRAARPRPRPGRAQGGSAQALRAAVRAHRADLRQGWALAPALGRAGAGRLVDGPGAVLLGRPRRMLRPGLLPRARRRAGRARRRSRCPSGRGVPVFILRSKGTKRQQAFDEQLPQLLLTMAASVRVGHSFRQSMQAVVHEGIEPASKEFGRVLLETDLGRPVDEALAEMAKRLGSQNFEYVIHAVSIQREAGGSLGELLRPRLRDCAAPAAVLRQGARPDRHGPAVRLHPVGAPLRRRRTADGDQPGVHEAALRDVDRPLPRLSRAFGHHDRLLRPQENRLLPALMMLLLLSAVFLGTAVFLVAEAATFPARRRNELVERASRYGRSDRGATVASARSARRSQGALTGLIGGLVLKVMPSKTRENLARKLLSAGLAEKVSPETVVAAKAVMCSLGLLAGFVLGFEGGPATGVLLGFCLGFLGFLGARRVRQRQGARPAGARAGGTSGRARPARRQRRGRSRVRRRGGQARRLHGRPADRRVRADVERDARRREPERGAEADVRARRRARARCLHPCHRPGRPARYLDRRHPAHPGRPMPAHAVSSPPRRRR